MKKRMNIIVVSIIMFYLPVLWAENKVSKIKRTAPLKAAPQKPTQLATTDNVIVYPGASIIPVLAKQAIVVDYNTGKVLLEKNADQRMAPSSMTKMATTYIIEEKLLRGEITAETEFKVSQKAWRTQGSKMFVALNSNVKVADLHKGIAIQSGNDASIVAAEGIMGTEEGFAQEMTRVAKEIGMTNTNFKNASGLPDKDHYSTARDLSKLAIATIKNHMNYYGVNQEKDFTYNGIKQGNRNPLLYDQIGCDGIKTGHTDAGGYGVTASCVDADQRYIVVINGLPSVQARADEARKLVGWAKGNFIGKTLVKKGDVVENIAKVRDGIKDTISLMAAKDIYVLTLRTDQSQIKLTPVVQELSAPIKANDPAGSLIAHLGDSRIEVDLIASESVEKLSFIKRMLKKLRGAIHAMIS